MSIVNAYLLGALIVLCFSILVPLATNGCINETDLAKAIVAILFYSIIYIISILVQILIDKWKGID